MIVVEAWKPWKDTKSLTGLEPYRPDRKDVDPYDPPPSARDFAMSRDGLVSVEFVQRFTMREDCEDFTELLLVPTRGRARSVYVRDSVCNGDPMGYVMALFGQKSYDPRRSRKGSDRADTHIAGQRKRASGATVVVRSKDGSKELGG